jgi:hypothetical protein
MKNDLLLFLGTGVMGGSILLGLAIALIYVLRGKLREFRYGAFYSVFAYVASIGLCLAAIAFYFQFLDFKIAVMCSVVALGMIGGLSLLAAYVRKDNRIVFVILSLYCLVVIWLAPVFIWNLIYLFAIAKQSQPQPDQSLEAALPPPIP